MNMVFVCTGNTCRSYMAEVMARKQLAAHGPRGITVTSAGTGSVQGAPAAAEAAEVLRELGYEAGGHQASRLNSRLVAAAHLIFTMTKQQKDYIEREYPPGKGKVFLLRDYPPGEESLGGPSLDIADPFGLSLDAYRECGRELEEAVKKMLEAIRADSPKGG